MFILLSVVLVVCWSEARGQTVLDTIDPGVRDEIWLSSHSESLGSEGNNRFSLDLWIKHDSVDITSLSAGFNWGNENVRIDSVVFSQKARAAFDFKLGGLRKEDIDTTNTYRQFLFFGVRLLTSGLQTGGDSILLATYYFSCGRWDRIDEIVIDTMTFSGGSQLVLVGKNPGERGSKFRYVPAWRKRVVIHDPDRPCCVNIMGNIDGEDGVDIGDQTLLIDHLFGTGVALTCVEAANVDGSADGSVDMADLIALTEHLFLGGQLAECK